MAKNMIIDNRGNEIEKLSIPLGWLVLAYDKNKISAMTFVPDPDHNIWP